MDVLSKLSQWIGRLCQFIGGLSLVTIVMVTMVDVVTRYLFRLTSGGINLTMKGGVELVSYFMLFALLAAFVAFVERSQVIVDVFTHNMKRTLKANLMGVFLLGFVVIGAIMTWGLYDNMHDAMQYGNVTQDLRISMTPIYAIAAILCLFLTVRSLIESIRIFVTGEYYDAEETGA